MRRAIILLAILTFSASAAFAADCGMCHDKKSSKHTHMALEMGCEACHGGVNAENIPHVFSGKGPKGLNAEIPELCFSCHDKAIASGKQTVHMPVMGGMCVSCHDAHGSEQPKLLKKQMEDLCYDCHDKTNFYGPTVHEPVGLGHCTNCHEAHQSTEPRLLKASGSDICFGCHSRERFTGTMVHAPIAGGLCTECHLPHASQNDSLLIRRDNLLCRKCHAEVEKRPHAAGGFTAEGHPVRGRKDPLRQGKVFGCVSCHLPHVSNSPTLFRFPAKNMYDICTQCHNF